MTAEDRYQAIVIGSGQGGTPLCRALAEAGLRTALIEREHVGGTCVNEGCTPTKTMVASARVAALARRGPGYGVQTGSIRVDMERVRQRKRDIVNGFRDGSQKRIEKTANLDLIFGEARFASPESVLVQLKDGGQRLLTGEKVFINAGARPAAPALDGLKDVPFLDSTSIMELEAVPEHLLVLGGGYVGLEFAQMFRRFGSRVTVVQSAEQLLGREDPDVAGAVAEILAEDGIEILLSAKASQVAQAESRIRLAVRRGSESVDLEGSHLLVATGRTPNTDSLNVSAAGIATDDRGFINVNERLETSREGIFALGDIKGGPAFTHISYDDFRILRTNIVEKGNATTAGRMLPVHGVHRSATRAHRADGSRSSRPAQGRSRCQDADDFRRPRVGSGRDPRIHESHRRRRERSHSRRGRTRARGWRDHVDAATGRHGQAARHRPARCCLCPPHAGRVSEQSVHVRRVIHVRRKHTPRRLR